MTGPLSTGPAVVLSGRWLNVARQAVHIAELARRRNGLPASTDYAALLVALNTAVSRNGHNVTDPEPVAAPSNQPDELTVEEAAHMLHKSKRQTQRMAPRLGGRLVGGRWLLDRRAVEEHLGGTRNVG